jgi:hypothetical protein
MPNNIITDQIFVYINLGINKILPDLEFNLFSTRNLKITKKIDTKYTADRKTCTVRNFCKPYRKIANILTPRFTLT